MSTDKVEEGLANLSLSEKEEQKPANEKGEKKDSESSESDEDEKIKDHKYEVIPDFTTEALSFGLTPQNSKTGIMFDEVMVLHSCSGHPERPERLTAIMNRLKLEKVLPFLVNVPSRHATREEILKIHSAKVLDQIIKSKESLEGDVIHIEADTYANKYTSDAAHVAAGGLIELTTKVLKGELKNGFAFIRPPGHHAEADQIMGFCLLNNVAIAAQYARDHLGAQRVLIVDWDVHHGNGTQHIFETRKDVMYYSVHKGGGFYPGTGKHNECGKEEGLGYTVNVPFSKSGMRDSDYLAAFKYVFMPIAREFKPDLVIVSAGFDCSEGDTLGPMKVSKAGFEHMLTNLMSLTPNVVCALEGGYELKSTSKNAVACVKILCGAPPTVVKDAEPMSVYAWKDIHNTMNVQAPYWPSIKKLLEEDKEWQDLCTLMAEKAPSEGDYCSQQ